MWSQHASGNGTGNQVSEKAHQRVITVDGHQLCAESGASLSRDHDAPDEETAWRSKKATTENSWEKGTRSPAALRSIIGDYRAVRGKRDHREAPPPSISINQDHA